MARSRPRRTVEVPTDGAGVPLADYAGYPALAAVAAMPFSAAMVAALEAIDPAGLDAGGQIRLAQQWSRVEAAACGRKLAAVGAMAGPAPTIEEIAANEGTPDFTDYEVGAALHLGGTSAQRLTSVARALTGTMTRALTALIDGELTYLQALQYAEAAEDLTPRQAERLQELTLGRARTKTPRELRRLLRRTVVRIGADDYARKHEAARDSVDATFWYDDATGMADLSARLCAIDAKIIETAVEAWVAAAKNRGDERPLPHLRAAAMVDLAERYLQAPDAPRRHGRPITANIAVELPTFLGLTEHPGELLGTGVLIPADALRELIPQAALRRIITDPMTGELLDYGRTTYRFPPDTSGYLIAKWVYSTGPGSLVPAERCDIDHALAWDDEGETNRDNGNPCDRRWHRAKTIGGWTVTQRQNKWVYTSPLGLTHETSPHDFRLGP